MSREDELREYRGDVSYQVWRNGGNPDAINNNQTSEHFYDGWFVDECADAEMAQQRRDRDRTWTGWGL